MATYVCVEENGALANGKVCRTAGRREKSVAEPPVRTLRDCERSSSVTFGPCIRYGACFFRISCRHTAATLHLGDTTCYGTSQSVLARRKIKHVKQILVTSSATTWYSTLWRIDVVRVACERFTSHINLHTYIIISNPSGGNLAKSAITQH